MKKHSLTPNNGLSLSDAQSVSNLCNQRAVEISKVLEQVNNFEKTIRVQNGDKFEDFVTVPGRELPSNVVELLKEKAKLHACQGFLVMNIKEKDELLKVTKVAKPDTSMVKYPDEPDYVHPEQLAEVNEDWGWEQLSVAEYNEYLEAEAFAAHIGQFIHPANRMEGIKGVLDTLRKELPTLPAVEWMTIEDGKKTPVKIKVHHTADGLMRVHEELAALHRNYEQKVNYFKAKVKNLVTTENARIAKENADKTNEADKTNQLLLNEYQSAFKTAAEEVNRIKKEFEISRQERIKEIASMRIAVDPRFQEIVNEFLKKIKDVKSE